MPFVLIWEHVMLEFDRVKDVAGLGRGLILAIEWVAASAMIIATFPLVSAPLKHKCGISYFIFVYLFLF